MIASKCIVSVALLVFCLGGGASFAGEPADVPDDEQLIAEILKLSSGDRSPNRPRLLAILGDRDGRELLLEHWRVEKAEDRSELLDLLVEYAGPKHSPQDRASYRARTDMEVAAALVDAMDDSNKRVREDAADVLEEHFCESAIRFFSPEIIRLVEKHTNVRAMYLLARTGRPEAAALLEKDPAYREYSAGSTNVAPAKLGNKELEAEFIDEFRNADDVHGKIRTANTLGYIGTRDACTALAEELRSPLVTTVERGVPRSLRVHIIEALRRALPDERRPWEPSERPRNNSYYIGIENWATRVLGVSWEEPRPPFFYSGYAIGRPPTRKEDK